MGIIEKIVGIILSLLGISWWVGCYICFKHGKVPQQGTVINTFIITMTGACLLLGGKIWILGIGILYIIGNILLLYLLIRGIGLVDAKLFHLISYLYVATYAVILSLILSKDYGLGALSSVVIGIGVTVGQIILMYVIAFFASLGRGID